MTAVEDPIERALLDVVVVKDPGEVIEDGGAVALHMYRAEHRRDGRTVETNASEVCRKTSSCRCFLNSAK